MLALSLPESELSPSDAGGKDDGHSSMWKTASPGRGRSASDGAGEGSAEPAQIQYYRAIVRREAREGEAGFWLLRRREPPLVLCSAIEDDRMRFQMQKCNGWTS
jgi:hypothetical protein